MKLRVGVDFDNTIAGHDRLIHRLAVEEGLIPEDFVRSKRLVRDLVRTLPEGAIHWQKIQAQVYGPRMAEAELMEGVFSFFKTCRNRGIPVFVVSHKTLFAKYDPTLTPLHDAARAWMTDKGFFDPDEIGLPGENVYFEPTRALKVRRIADLRLTHFVDDLEETFLAAGFPSNTERILYAPHGHDAGLSRALIRHTWASIEEYLFHDRP